MQTAYTAKAKKAIDIATRISKSLHHSYIGTEHILLGLLKEGTGVASQVLADNGVEYDKVLELIEELIAPGNVVAVLEDGLSPRAAHVLEVSKAEAARFHSEISSRSAVWTIPSRTSETRIRPPRKGRVPALWKKPSITP